jgi:hypothetical protein
MISNEIAIRPRKFYEDLSYIGKHYLVWNSKGIKRHYTISNCMKKDIYDEYIRVINEAIDDKTTNLTNLEFKDAYLDCLNEPEFVVTVKNYKMPNGISLNLHSALDEKDWFSVKGPLGKGLEI